MGDQIYNGKHLRQNRYSLVGRAYMVTTCCDYRKPVFRNVKLGKLLVDELRRSDTEFRTYTYAYVVMPDHLHWLFQLLPRNSLSSVVRRVKGRSAYRLNQFVGRTGAIWQPGFHDRLIRAEESLEVVDNYVIHNPVRAGIVTAVDEYPLWDVRWERCGQPIRG